MPNLLRTKATIIQPSPAITTITALKQYTCIGNQRYTQQYKVKEKSMIVTSYQPSPNNAAEDPSRNTRCALETPKKLTRVGVSERHFSKTEYREVKVSNGEVSVCPGAHFVLRHYVSIRVEGGVCRCGIIRRGCWLGRRLVVLGVLRCQLRWRLPSRSLPFAESCVSYYVIE